MRLSERVKSLKESSTLAVTARATAMRVSGIDVIGFGMGEPDFDTPAHVKQAAINALQAGKTKYTATAGDLAARQAIAQKLARENQVHVGPEDVTITAGAKHAIYMALQCLLDPGRGQEVVLPTPAWVSYRPLIELAGGTCVEVAGAMANEFKMTPEQLSKAITPRTAAFIFNSPSNPCGTVYEPAEIEALAEVLRQHPNVVIITDEIYEKLIFPEGRPSLKHVSMASLPGLGERTITINGMSKAYAMTGWRIGYAACPPKTGFAAQMVKLQGQMTNNVTSFTFAAIVEALSGPQDSVETMRQAYGRRGAMMHQRLSEAGMSVVKPTGAFYVFPEVTKWFGKASSKGRRIEGAASFAEALLEEANVAVVPGDDFGAGSERYVRLCFACAEPAIEEGCRRIAAWLGQIH
jgi:aspartate aminotransferase